LRTSATTQIPALRLAIKLSGGWHNIRFVWIVIFIFSTDDISSLHRRIPAPQANAFCERWIGTVRRECLDFLMPLNDRHLRRLLKEWVTHYNRGRPHASLGPGIPDLRAGQQRAKLCGHRVPMDQQVVATAILGGLHHEYRLERIAA
jgi:putative transposase